ncbi:MAG TPA: MaoC family dehydratase [Bryobacteraceae bacterium]|nr:MaoC family dehydratase [Bryobacteraceae bacterium]
MTDRYLEDLKVGEKTKTASVTITEAEMLDFSRQFDPQPMHTDPNVEGGLIASGWHTAAVVMRLVADARPLGDLPLLGMGVDGIQWPQPVRPGDTIQVETEVLAIRPSKSKPTHGIVKLRSTARNQQGEVVYVVTPNVWVPRRPA